MSLSPEAARFVEMAMSGGGAALHTMSVDQARAAVTGMLDNPGPSPALQITDYQVAVEDGSILVRVVTPDTPPRGVIVYIHGGGFILGTAAEHEPLCRQIAAATSCIVAIADYRLAPEFPFPIPVNDSYGAVKWAAHKFGLPLVVMGDSAGGNLGAAIAQMAKVDGGPKIAAQVLIYPVTDSAMNTASYDDPKNQLLLTRETAEWFWDLYVPDKSQRSDPRVAPIRAASLSGLPPAIVVLASHDMLFDEGKAYADRLHAAGVPCELMVAEGEIHGFFVMAGIMPAAKVALQFIAQKLDAMLT
jgi:acetyl esterase